MQSGYTALNSGGSGVDTLLQQKGGRDVHTLQQLEMRAWTILKMELTNRRLSLVSRDTGHSQAEKKEKNRKGNKP